MYIFCIPTTINKPIKACFLEVIGIQNQLPSSFGKALVCNKILKIKVFTPHTHEFLIFSILSNIKSEPKGKPL